MALKITYWSASRNPNISGSVLLTESRSLSGTSAQSGATPTNADYVSIVADEVAAVDYSSANPTALAGATGTSTYMAAGERLWFDAKPDFKIAGIQAS